jgi:DNA-binding LacI/PurR family transcriptional regulator
MSQTVTIRDIARHLRLSSATVSLALNDAPGVNPETRQKVKEYARGVRYRPNAAARAISTGRSHLVTVVLSRLDVSFFEEIVQGIENVAYRGDYDVIVNTVGETAQPEAEFIDRLIARHIDGMIGSVYLLSEEAIRRLKEAGIPVLLLTPIPVDGMPCVSVDNRLGGRLVAEHLLALGHRRVLFIGDGLYFSRLRAEGAGTLLAEAGGHLETRTVPTMLEETAAQEGVTTFLRENPDFTAVFCAGDVLAVGACKAVQAAGLRIPQDVSVVGFDDLRWIHLLTPPLTTVHQPQVSQGETAMRMLAEIMEGRVVESRMLEPRLVVRSTTGPAPR